jgi:hypothetical protein
VKSAAMPLRGQLLPFVAAFLFVFAVIGSAGYLLQVVADEKENRTMEIMVTSVTPLELIGGKALGLMAVTLEPDCAVGDYHCARSRRWRPLY